MLAAPLGIAAAYGTYNYVRFDNPLEFGHNYLPEFVQAPQGQFSTRYMGNNLRNILRLPWLEDGRLMFHTSYGFAFWLCNPIFVLFGIRALRAAVQKKWDATDTVLVISLCAHFALLLMHKSFGGVQWGTRYLCDLAPALFFGVVRRDMKLTWYEMLLMAWGVAFNIYGAYAFQTIVYGG